jgi:predicted lipoprotein with Yx(FWY)xxD motif
VGPVRLRTRTVRAGTVVVDDQGLTLYAFDKDKGDFESNCAGACAKDWPPVLTDGRVTVGPGINSALASTITRPDGTMQVEYNGWPLYHYAKDTEPRETKGQAVTAYGGPWYVLGDDGKRIKKKR